MQIITEKDLSAKKKPVQVYFDRETLILMQARLAEIKPKIGMAEYIRGLVEDDVEGIKKKAGQRTWMKKPLGLNLSSNSREIDKIIYGA